MIGYVFTDHLTWSWEDFSDSKVHHFSNSEHRQSHIDDLKQDGTAYYPFYLTGNPHLVVLSDNLQAVYQERIATEGQDAANDFLKRTGRRLVADYDRWIKRDVYGAAIETWKQKGGLVTRDDSATVMPAGCESRPAFLGLEAAVAGLREAMAQRCPAPGPGSPAGRSGSRRSGSAVNTLNCCSYPIILFHAQQKSLQGP